MDKRIEKLPTDVSRTAQEYGLLISADLQDLDGVFHEQIANAGWPDICELTVSYALERFDVCAEYLLPFSVSQDPAAINPQYEADLDKQISAASAYLSVLFRCLRPDFRADLIEQVELKLHGRKLRWLAGAKVRHLERMKASAASAKATPAGPRSTEQQAATKWEQLEIWFLSDERVQIKHGLGTETRNYSEMGFADRRNGKPNQQWLLLRLLAESRGFFRDPSTTSKKWPQIEKQFERIRKQLRALFKIPGDPLPFTKNTGYRAIFKIGCTRSYDH